MKSEDDLPVNPPGFFREGDVMMTEVDIANWEGDGGYFQPRLRDSVQWVQKLRRQAAEDEASEIDDERLVDCD
jgi:hypothetical protein